MDEKKWSTQHFATKFTRPFVQGKDMEMNRDRVTRTICSNKTAEQ